MKRIFNLIYVIIVALSLCYSTNIYASDVSYDIEKQEIIAEINSNGDVQFTDQLTYEIDYLNGVIFTLDRVGYDIADYKVGIIDPQTQNIIYFEENATGSPKTYQVMQSSTAYEFKVFYPTSDATITFVFEYTIKELITNYIDTAELNRKIVGTKTDESLDVEALIVLPAKVTDTQDFRAWAHGAPQGKIELTEYDGKSAAHLSVANNPPNQFVEINMIFPTALTPNNTNQVDELKKDDIIQRETQQVEADLKKYEQSKRVKQLVLFLVCGGIILMPIFCVYYYLTKRRQLNPNPVKLPEHIFELPEELTPAIMATAVLRHTPTSDDFAATILDLARKEIIVLEEVENTQRRGLTRKQETTLEIKKGKRYDEQKTLQKHEKYALDYILPKGQTRTLIDIERAVESKSRSKAYYRLWTRFVNYTQIQGMRRYGSQKEQQTAMSMLMLGSVLSCVLYGVAAVLLINLYYTNYLLFLAIGALVTLIIYVVMYFIMKNHPIQTAEQDRMQQEWSGFRNMLHDIGNFKMREIASLELWQEYLVYAVSLGVADKVIEAMRIQLPKSDIEQMALARTLHSDPYVLMHLINQSMRHNVRQAVYNHTEETYTKHTGSNSGGFGGGFSSGSSGGSGGGSGAGGF